MTAAGFAPEWLALRERADAEARAAELLGPLRESLPASRLVIRDLGCGTGSMGRWLAGRLDRPQHWVLHDRDPRLLALAEAALATEDVTVETRRAELAGLRAADLAGTSLVTASALLDLVSAGWVDALARRCLDARATALFALTYDGRMSFEPREADDEAVAALVNRHQLGDKGFGPALGPAAGERARETFAELGFNVATARSEWRVDADAGELQAALLDGWRAAAREIAPECADALERWAAARHAHVAAGRSTLTVGHVDLLAWLAGGSRES